MPIRGDRLRWPPRPGKKFPGSSESRAQTETRRSPSTDQSAGTDPLRQPHERDETADRTPSAPHQVIKQAHDDVQSGKKDTDCRNQTTEVLDRASKRSSNPARDS